MRIAINAAALAKELEPMARTADRKQVMEVCRYVLLSAKSERLSMNATDFNVRLRSECDAEVSEPGEALFEASRLLSIAKLAPEDAHILIHTNKTGTQATVEVENYKATIQLLQVSDFPAHQEDIPGDGIDIDASSLRQMLRQIDCCVPNIQYASALPGVEIKCSAGSVALLAMDGRRGGMGSAPCVDGALSAIIPKIATRDIMAFLEGCEKVNAKASRDCISLTTEHRRLDAKLLDGPMAAVAKAVPVDPSHGFTIDRDALARSIKRVCIVADSVGGAHNDKIQTVKFEYSDKGVSLSAVGRSVGDADEQLQPMATMGPSGSFKINSYFALDFLAAAAPGLVSIAYKGDKGPMLWKQLGDSPVTYQQVVSQIVI